MDKSISQFQEIKRISGEEYLLLAYPNIKNAKIKAKNLLIDAISDASADNKLYGRKNYEWCEINIPDTSNFITTEEVNIKLNTKQDKGDYATIQELTEGLNTKQPLGDYATKSELPDVSSFITASVDNLANYYLKTQTYDKQQVNELIDAITQINFEIVDNLPSVGEKGTFYLVLNNKSEENNWYDEYVYMNQWEKIGTTKVDLTDYYTKSQTDSIINTKQDKLINGQNIATINGQSLLNGGNIVIENEEQIVYTADNVLFNSDLVITSNIGVHTIDSSGSKTLQTTGKSVKQVFDMLVADEKNPTITQPYVNITLTGAGTKEVGTMFTPSYRASLNPGSYQYGPATGVTATSWTITDTNGGNKNTSSGSFTQFQVTDNTNYKITAQAQHTEGTIPVTNLGNNYESGKINAGSKSKVSSTVTGYRNSFYGTFTNKNELTSNTIRTLTKSNRALSNGATFNISIPVGALRVVIAYPATLRALTSVLDVNGLNAQIVTSFTESRLNVEGLNSYQAIEYRVYTLDYANPNDKGNTYKVTI